MRKAARISIIHSGAAGIDIGTECHVVAVPPGADSESVQTSQRFTGDHRSGI